MAREKYEGPGVSGNDDLVPSDMVAECDRNHWSVGGKLRCGFHRTEVPSDWSSRQEGNGLGPGLRQGTETNLNADTHGVRRTSLTNGGALATVAA